MKNTRWQRIAFAVAAVFSLGLAQATDLANYQRLRERAWPDGPRCATVKVGAPIKFHGRTLVEAPDITEPDLRLANELLSAGCPAGALRRVDTVLRANPDNRNAQYVIARASWMLLGQMASERVLNQVLGTHGHFVSARVLQAGIRFEQDEIEEMKRLLDIYEPKSPTDLWIYMNRLRLEAIASPTPELRARALEIARSPAFPPIAREAAARAAKVVPNQSDKDFEEVLQAEFAIDSSVGLPCKAMGYASWLSDPGRKRFADTIKLLESPRASAGYCTGLETNRLLLAHAYLMEAAKIYPRGANPKNQNLVDRADQVVDGEYDELISFAMSRSDSTTLYPFLRHQIQKMNERLKKNNERYKPAPKPGI